MTGRMWFLLPLVAVLALVTACGVPAPRTDSPATEDILLRVLAPDGGPLTDVDVYWHEPAGWDVGSDVDFEVAENDVIRVRLPVGYDRRIPLSIASRGLGAVAVPLPPSGGREFTVRFPEPGFLDLTVFGIHGDPGRYGIVVRPVGEGPSDGHYEGTIHEDDDLAEFPFPAGEYDLEIYRFSLGYDPLFEGRIAVRPGVNRVRVRILETHDLTVRLPAGSRGEWLAAWSASGSPIDADREEEDRFEYGGLPPGTYTFVLEHGEREEAMAISVPVDGPIVFRPSRIDALRVNLWRLEPDHDRLARAGLEDDDLIVEIQGREFTNWSGARDLLRAAGSAPEVELSVIRGERRLELTVPGSTFEKEFGLPPDLIPTVR